MHIIYSFLWLASVSLAADYDLPVAKNEIKVMSYNVENLFDTQDDPGKLDETFLPKNHPKKKTECQKLSTPNYIRECRETDWTPAKLAIKLNQIKKVVQAQGDEPDIIGLVEVENKNVLKQLADLLGYTHYFISEGPDSRGIDVAMMYKEDKIRLISSSEISLVSYVPNTTRPILKALFEIKHNQRPVVVYVNHWPSQAASTPSRLGAARAMQDDIQRSLKKNPDTHFIALGDFNVIDTEDSDVFPHLDLRDVQTESELAGNPMKDQMPPGSHFYIPDKSWSRLDRILISRDWLTGNNMQLLPMSFRIVATGFLLQTYKNQKIPKRYNFKATNETSAGFSDHLSLAVKLQIY